MDKIYTRIRWENDPSIKTPLNETNLNAMDLAIDRLDTRIVEMSGYEEIAHGYANEARESADRAESYKNTAGEYKDTAETYRNLAESYAKGTNNTVRAGDSTDNAKFYKEEAYRCLAGNVIAAFEINEDGKLVYSKTFYGDDAENHFNFSIVDNRYLQVEII